MLFDSTSNFNCIFVCFRGHFIVFLVSVDGAGMNSREYLARAAAAFAEMAIYSVDDLAGLEVEVEPSPSLKLFMKRAVLAANKRYRSSISQIISRRGIVS